jgi:hypothetical protein
MRKRVGELPSFLSDIIEEKAYFRWLERKANAHVKRDRARFGRESCVASTYRAEIHNAVVRSCGRDHYTGQPLSWDLISCFENGSAREHFVKFANLPTVDHAADEQRPSVFCNLLLVHERRQRQYERERVFRVVRSGAEASARR